MFNFSNYIEIFNSIMIYLNICLFSSYAPADAVVIDKFILRKFIKVRKQISAIFPQTESGTISQ